MSDTNPNRPETNGTRRSVEIREALWIVAMALIGLIMLVLLHLAGKVMAEFTNSGQKEIPIMFWILSTLYLAACISIFWLLRNSKSAGFKILAYLLTGVAPIIGLAFVVHNLLRLGN